MRRSVNDMQEKLTVATVLKPQGIRGELKVVALCDGGEDLKAFRRVFIEGAEYALLSVRAQGGIAYIALKGIADRNAAELLRGKNIEVLREDCPPLPEGRYYIADLVGCRVVTESGRALGEVTAVTPAHTDIYTLSTPSGEVSFAAADGVIADVDTRGGVITVNYKRYKEVSV